MKQLTFNLPARCAINSITLRETNGRDEQQASLSAKEHGTSLSGEMVEIAIVEVNGEPVLPGASEFRRWPTRTRSAVSKFCSHLNGVQKSSLFPFIQEAEEENTEIVDGETRVRYRFPEGFDLKWVVLREMMETDERSAAAVAGRQAETVEDEMVRRCVVSTDLGEGMSLRAIQNLSTRTRIVLSTYWQGMNFVDEEELDPLVMAAEATATAVANVSVESSEGQSSENGSGSQAQAGAA